MHTHCVCYKPRKRLSDLYWAIYFLFAQKSRKKELKGNKLPLAENIFMWGSPGRQHARGHIFLASHPGVLRNDHLFVLFCCFTSQVNSYGHGGTVSSPYDTFSWASLNKQLTSTFVHILSLVTDNNPPWMIQPKGRRMTIEIISWSISAKVWERAGTRSGQTL